MSKYLIVGSGYRSEFYARLSVKYPKLFQAMFLCRSQEKADALMSRTGVRAVTSKEEAVRFEPDFVVVVVDLAHIGDVAIEWAQMGYPVLAETPIGNSVEKLLKIWEMHEEGAKIVCCEQYHRYPVMAEGFRYINRGLIGTPISLYLSLAHKHHGMSLIRRLLMTYDETYTLHAVQLEKDVVSTDSRAGAVFDGSKENEQRDIVTIEFSSGKTAIYDFASLQYRSYIRTRHLILRGEKGEWNDRFISYVGEDNLPKRVYLMPEIPAAYSALDTQDLRDLRKSWSPELYLDQQQDEFAIASILMDMESYIRGGKEPYPLKEALDDAYFGILRIQAVENPWQEIKAEKMPWNTAD